MSKHDPSRCVNCGAEVWLGAFFDGPFLCSPCQARAAVIIQRLKRRSRRTKLRTLMRNKVAKVE
jgi:hypothetical protein